MPGKAQRGFPLDAFLKPQCDRRVAGKSDPRVHPDDVHRLRGFGEITSTGFHLRLNAGPVSDQQSDNRRCRRIIVFRLVPEFEQAVGKQAFAQAY